MKQEPTKLQVMDALATYKSVQKAANALGIKYPTMQKYLRQYGICVNHEVKSEQKQPWYKRFFRKGE